MVVYGEQVNNKGRNGGIQENWIKSPNAENNSIYNYLPVDKNVGSLTGTPRWRENAVNTNVSHRKMHARTQQLLHIWKRTLLSTLEYLDSAICKNSLVPRQVNNANAVELFSHKEPLLRSTFRQTRNDSSSVGANLWECKCVSQAKTKTSQTSRTHIQRVDRNVLLVTLEVKFKGLTARRFPIMLGLMTKIRIRLKERKIGPHVGWSGNVAYRRRDAYSLFKKNVIFSRAQKNWNVICTPCCGGEFTMLDDRKKKKGIIKCERIQV